MFILEIEAREFPKCLAVFDIALICGEKRFQVFVVFLVEAHCRNANVCNIRFPLVLFNDQCCCLSMRTFFLKSREVSHKKFTKNMQQWLFAPVACWEAPPATNRDFEDAHRGLGRLPLLGFQKSEASN